MPPPCDSSDCGPDAPQARQPPEWFRPRWVADLFPPGYFEAKVSPWVQNMEVFLQDSLANGTDTTARGLGDLVFGQDELLPAARGVFWESLLPGELRPTDFMRRPGTHLNLEMLLSYREHFDDKAILHHIEWGVDFFAGGRGPEQERTAGMQMVLQQHLVSLCAGFSKLQEDLLRRTELGWHQECWWWPRFPYERTRASTRASAPHLHTRKSRIDPGISMAKAVAAETPIHRRRRLHPRQRAQEPSCGLATSREGAQECL